MRGTLRLAERTDGALDHRNGEALTANLSVLEESGWMVTSLGETRNRADLLVLVGDGLMSRFPRFTERVVQPAARLHAESPLALVRIGSGTDHEAEDGPDVQVPPGRMRDFIGVLRARLAGRRLDADPFPGATTLAERLAAAKYPVIAFAASAFGTEPHPDLTVRALSALVRDLNAKGRAALLPLGGADGETTANQVSAWHSGFAVRQSFHGGMPEYRPRDGGAERLLESGGADALIWVSTLSNEPPPAADIPTLALGHPAMRFEREPEVYIPLAVPGVHRAGAIHRGDGVALLPLSAIADSQLPTSADIFARLLELVVEEG
jgi:formylmethanofuran dehydrogenase subunit B